jgi:molybdate transport system ATP-binding protein
MSLIVKIKKQLDNFMLSVDMELTDEIVSVIGMSGSGKSMTLKCIAGIETPDSGFISLNDRVLYDSKNRINLHPGKRRVGYLFQDYALFPTMTVMENICIAMGHRDEKKVKVWLKRYGLDGMADTYPDHLSGGQRQRVAMLRMLAAKPECILLDEPFSALDEHVKRSMESELMEMLTDFNNPVVFVSHNRDEVYRLAERIGSMERGVLSTVRDKKDFFMRPMSVEQALLVGCNNISEVKWQDNIKLLLKDWSKAIECTVSSRVLVVGCEIATCIRQKPFAEDMGWDSGWLFLADGDEDNDECRYEYCDLNTICNYSPDVMQYLDFPYDTRLVRKEDGKLYVDEE